jgi:hypothetical protein
MLGSPHGDQHFERDQDPSVPMSLETHRHKRSQIDSKNTCDLVSDTAKETLLLLHHDSHKHS